MITVTDANGNRCLVNSRDIVVTEVTSGTAMRYRGINSTIFAANYKSIECRETVAQITKQIQTLQPATGWPPGLLQDDCRALATWLSEKPDALYRLRQLYQESGQPSKSCLRCNTPKKCAIHGCSPNTWESETKEGI